MQNQHSFSRTNKAHLQGNFRWRITPLWTFGLLFYALLPPAHAGVVFNNTRFIYESTDKSITIRAKNNTNLRYLIKTAIVGRDNRDFVGTFPVLEMQPKVPFIALPPIYLLQPQREGTVRIVMTDQILPDNKESLFLIKVTSIPEAQIKNNSLQMAVRETFKLFYRPAGLEELPAQRYSQLKWARKGKTVTVNNPTPWFATLVNVTVNNTAITHAGMVAPMTQRQMELCPASGKCTIEWQGMDDYGQVTARITTLL